MIKWPEPALVNEIRYSGIAVNKMVTENLYTEAQLKQAVRDAYEECANVIDNADSPDCGGWDMTHIAERIRALIKEIA